jgi:uncharacterized membrane protein YfcA
MSRAHAVHVRHAAHRLVRWQRVMLYGTGAALLVSGAAWLAIHYTVGAGAGELPHPLEAWCLRVHGLASFAALFVLGAITAAHIPQGWRLTGRRRWSGQRRSGLLLCIGSMLLALTGYLLYYFAPENLRPALGWVHAGIGTAVLLLGVDHRQPHGVPDRRAADGTM